MSTTSSISIAIISAILMSPHSFLSQQFSDITALMRSNELELSNTTLTTVLRMLAHIGID